MNEVEFDEDLNHMLAEQYQKDQTEQWRAEIQRKSKAQKFLDEYIRNKPAHTELSMIREKYGYSNPAVQIMKLKMDEAQLLSKYEEDGDKAQLKLNLLLKSIKAEGKIKIDCLFINCEQSNSKIKTETKIILPEPINSKVDINYLYTLPSFSATDVLTFESKDGRAEIQIGQLKQKTKVDLKHKSTGKKIAQIEYGIISEGFIESSKLKKGKENAIEDQNRQDRSKNQIKRKQNIPKEKVSYYINILNWPEDQITLKNGVIGTVNASKVIF